MIFTAQEGEADVERTMGRGKGETGRDMGEKKGGGGGDLLPIGVTASLPVVGSGQDEVG